MNRRPDIIDVNRTWTVFVGSRSYAYSIGVVRHATRALAAAAAREQFPGRNRMFVEPMFPEALA